MIKVQLSKKTTVTLSDADVRNLTAFTLAVVVAVFCLLGSKTLLAKTIYQQKVISASNKANKQLDINLKNSSTLSTQYSSLFENSDPSNVLGGKSDTSTQAVPPNIDNARIALDALPSIYDYPATVASLTKILTDDGITTPNITGTDQTGTVSNAVSSSPEPVAIVMGFTGTGSYRAVQKVLSDLERSIRPFDVTSVQLSGSETQLTINASLTTYFQPAKVLGITPKEIK